MNKFGIDVETKHKNHLMRRLNALKTTELAEDGGIYHADASYSQVILETSWDEAKLEDWLWATKGIESIGVFKVKQ